MTSSRPYLLRAIYEWLLNNGLTPYLMVDADYFGTRVPKEHIKEGKIVLNVSPDAVANLELENHAVEFDAGFSGKSVHLYLPIPAIKAIYAIENGRGMVFDDEDEDGPDPMPPEDGPTTKDAGSDEKPTLRIVK